MCILRKKLTRHEQEFINAVAEMTWRHASCALQAIGSIQIDQIIADSDLQHGVLEFAAFAPVHELSALQVTGVRSTGELRNAMIAAHVKAGLSLLAQSNDRALLHVGSCCSLFRPEADLDELFVELAKTMAKHVGDMDREAATAYPMVQIDPCTPAPDMLTSSELARAHLAAACLPLLARGLSEMGARVDIVAGIVEAAFDRCHWPTWRNFGWLDKDIASAVLSKVALTDAARAHLLAIQNGYLFVLNSERRW